MSTWSNPSVASTASLTSDNDLTSPGTRDSTPSPPFPATVLREPVPALEKPLSKEPTIAAEGIAEGPEKIVEAGLGRRRCITFACGKQPNEPKPIKEQSKEASEQKSPEPPKRKCLITFACPARPTAPSAPSLQNIKIPRNTSPAPVKRAQRPPPSPKPIHKAHRGSDSTVKNDSPKSLRKVPSTIIRRRKYSDDNQDIPAEERRFHEFGPIATEAEQWLEESTCHRNRLTVNDTLIKETIIRRIGEEVEEEALEDDDFEDDDLDVDDEVDEDDEDEEDEEDEEEAESGASGDEVSDAGFQTDDEDGFAVSDSEGDDSDNEWWTAGRSTAATSMEHLDNLRLSPRHRVNSQSSLESDSAEHLQSRPPQGKVKRKTKAMKIRRPVTPDLPDSTDFVCGTLDEDRPLEQAYISCIEQRKAARYKARPQDIDPTFPTSDPEMDEEDDDEDDSDGEHRKVDESDHPYFLHGKIDLHNEDSDRRGRQPSVAGARRKTPSPPLRMRSPPPAKRLVHRSPPPPTKRTTLKSPAPIKRTKTKSPPASKRTSRSPPPPRRLFGHTSPKGRKSPAPPSRRVASPPPSRRISFEATPGQGISFTPRATLAQRPQPTHTASLPRVESVIKLGRAPFSLSSSEFDEVLPVNARGAIDIVKGLEKKRQRRREKLYQKHCNRNGKDREHKRPKPGKGAERMREVGLELAAYKGKKEHMLSY
ncbi:hypothetical protein AAFC00_005243 [Neodothiora populina]